MKLSNATLAALDPRIGKPAYDRTAVTAGIVHIGVGGFHRAHQAVYTEALLNEGLADDWGICGLGLRPEDRRMQQALAAQDQLYTLVELGDSDGCGAQVIGAITQFLTAEEGGEAVLAKLASPEVRIVSLTITEGGYCMDDTTGAFNAELPAIQHDLAHPQAPRTVFGFIAEALARRRAAGVAPFTVMSCDNLPHNGDVTRKALLAFSTLRDPQLSRWIDANVCFPNAMVDRITPMTSDRHRAQLAAQHGIEDQWPVVCEPFLQWVLEDKFGNGRPAWEKVGVQFTDDVTPYEEMKIGLLNGSHLALTYLGFLLGYRFAHETMEDPQLRRFVRDYMDLDVTPLLAEVPGIDLAAYKDQLIERFANRAIGDQLERICSDGSSKFPKFVMPTLHKLIAEGRELKRAALILASWAHYLRGCDERGEEYAIPDPRAAFLQARVADPASLTRRFLGVEEIFGPQVPACQALVSEFETSLRLLETDGVQAALRRVLETN